MIPEEVDGKSMITETSLFALREFDLSMTMLQQKLYYMSVNQIKKGEDPNDSPLYKMDMSLIARIMNTDKRSLKRNMKSAVESLESSSVGLRPLIRDTSTNKIGRALGIYQTIFTSEDDPNQIEVRFNYDFRKKILQMKEVHDIAYPLTTIAGLSSKYSIPLYIFLIASASILRDERTSVSNKFDIEVEVDKLMDIMQYSINKPRTVSNFNLRALKPAVEDLNRSSEIHIENDMPEYICEGKKIIKYIFHIQITTTLNNPIFAKPIIKGIGGEIPPADYIFNKLKDMGVAHSFIVTVKLHNSLRRTWSNLLYTWLRVGNSAKYFNAAFREDYFSNLKCDLSHVFRLLLEEKPEYRDEVMMNIEQIYDSKEIPASPSFMKSLLKKIKEDHEKTTS